MRRVLVIGPCGAGKSTLARKLARRTGLPLYHMDRLHWRPGWVERTREELIDELRPIIESERWIIDGNYGGTLPLRLTRADTVVFLDYPRRIYFARVLERVTLRRWIARPDMADGCEERLDPAFLRYVWRFHRDVRPRTLAILATNHNARLITLQHPRETARFLRDLPAT